MSGRFDREAINFAQTFPQHLSTPLKDQIIHRIGTDHDWLHMDGRKKILGDLGMDKEVRPTVSVVKWWFLEMGSPPNHPLLIISSKQSIFGGSQF